MMTRKQELQEQLEKMYEELDELNERIENEDWENEFEHRDIMERAWELSSECSAVEYDIEECEDDVVIFETVREGYSPDQCRETFTVGELIRLLEDYPEDAKVYFSFDKGYTYGSFNWNTVRENVED